MNRFFFVLSIIVIPTLTYSQKFTEDTSTSEKQSIIRLSILSPGFLAEMQIKNSITVTAGIRLGFEYNTNSSNLNLFPILSIEPRYYTTLEKRKRQGKRTEYFSSGYVGLPFVSSINIGVYSIGVLYGFQNVIGKKGFWNIGIGYGYLSNGERGLGRVIGDLGIGFILN